MYELKLGLRLRTLSENIAAKPKGNIEIIKGSIICPDGIVTHQDRKIEYLDEKYILSENSVFASKADDQRYVLMVWVTVRGVIMTKQSHF